jgi:hypothetical protein
VQPWSDMPMTHLGPSPGRAQAAKRRLSAPDTSFVDYKVQSAARRASRECFSEVPEAAWTSELNNGRSLRASSIYTQIAHKGHIMGPWPGPKGLYR